MHTLCACRTVCVSHCVRVALSACHTAVVAPSCVRVCVCRTAVVRAGLRACLLAHREQVAFDVDDLLRSTFEQLASQQEAVGVHVTLEAVLMHHEMPPESMDLAGILHQLSFTCPLDIQVELFVDTWPSR